MENKKLWMLMLIIGLVLWSVLVGCDISTGGSTNNDDGISFTCGNYTLSLYKNESRAVYIPATGDQYEIRNSSGNVISSGNITVGADGTYTFSPFSGKPNFSGSLSPNAVAFQITSAITLDDGTQLPGLSLSNTEDNGNEVIVYTSYAAAADAGYLFHNGQIGDLGVKENFDAFSALMKTLDYTQIKINSNLPIRSDFKFDFSVIVNELNWQANDYFKWDIQYNDHRILVRYYYGDATIESYTLVNEVLLLPEIKGEDYSAGTIEHVDFEYGVSDNSIVRNAIYSDTLIYDEFSINGKAPVDNLGLLQTIRIVNAIKTARDITLQAGDYLIWKITYSDSKWNILFFIEIINADGSIGLWSGNATKE
jgi:hypothetical protein